MFSKVFSDRRGVLSVGRIWVEIVLLIGLVSPLVWAQIPLAEIPLEFHRRAAQLVEEMRGSEFAPGWKEAQLGESVWPFFRPDVDGFAYYEFQVIPDGFIILSTGDHDFPIAHWNYTGLISTELQREAEESGRTAVRFFKLDALSYIAEDDSGELTAGGETLPPKLMGMDPAWLDLDEFPLTEVVAKPEKETESDDWIAEIDYDVEIKGPESSPIEFGEWESWDELKALYLDTYIVPIEALRREASVDWEIEEMAREVGEGLVPGEVYTLALLYPKAQWKVYGDGVDFVHIEWLDQRGAPPVLEITVRDAPRGAVAPFEVFVSYMGGYLEETIRFVVLDPSIVEGREEEVGSLGTEIATGPGLGVGWLSPGSWGPWHIFWAGTHAYQRLYDPFQIGGCESGCGATAWAMLFGWADHQAWVGNSYWIGRWGLYRQNGGKHPASDADAPRLRDQGITNITTEIRGYIGTWCSSGATPPWNMHEARKYFINRTGTTLSTYYNPFGFSWYECREKARDSIIYRNTPAVIGTGLFSHYALAYGYGWRSRIVGWWIFSYTQYSRCFFVNQGWRGYNNGWISASTWFAGQIYP